MTAAWDSTAGYRWLPHPERSRRLLVWPEGFLSVPESLTLRGVEDDDLELPYAAGLRGFSGTKGLVFAPGDYPLDDPLLLDDGRFQLFAAAGRLTIAADRIFYARPVPRRDPRADYLIAAAILILSLVLLARARARTRRR
jgi:hypothetical protein